MCACEEHIWLVCAHARCDTDALASDTNDLRRLVERMVPFWPSRNRVYSGRELRVCVCVRALGERYPVWWLWPWPPASVSRRKSTGS